MTNADKTVNINDSTTAEADLWDTAQVAARYKVTTMTVLRWVENGCPCVWPSERSRRFDPLEVARWVTEQTAKRLRTKRKKRR